MDNKAKDVAMQMAEDARQAEWEHVSFTAEVFKGSFRWDLVHPFPAQSPEDRKIGDDYLVKVREVLERRLEAPRLTAALARLRGSSALLTRPARPTPFAFPLLVEMFRESLSTEELEARVARMVAELEAAAKAGSEK